MNALPRRRHAAVPATALMLSLGLTALGIGGLHLTGCAMEETAVASSAPAGDAVARGHYLVTVMGCGDCHTPMKMGPQGPEPDLARAMSGHPEDLVMPAPPALEGPWVWAGAGTNTAFAGPWGVTYATNLTPDDNTGLGIWTEEMFVTALRTGKHMGQSRPIMPPMPWPAFSQATDDDLKAMYAYLRSLQPIHNRVPAYQPPAAATAAG